MMNKNFKNSVLEKIQKKEVSMYPKFYFFAQTMIITILSFLVFLSIVFVLSFVFFSFHESGEQLLLGFGSRGIITFFGLFPWAMIVTTILLLLLLEWILRYFKFSYRISILRIFLYTLIVTIVASILFTFTPIHSSLLKKAEIDQLPVIGHMYDSIHDSHQDKGVVKGTVVSIQSNTFVISHNDYDKDADDGKWSVVIPTGFDILSVRVGEKVYVAGSAIEGTIQAYGIKEFTPND